MNLLNGIHGTWNLVRFQIEELDGSKRDWGKGVHGLLLYAPTGHMSVSINKDIETDPEQTDIENRFDSILFYSGTFAVDGNQITHKVTEASNPDRIGHDLIRYAEFDKDFVTLTTPKESFGRAILTWRKEKVPLMSKTSHSEYNRKAYDLWSKQYDQDANSTIAVDDRHFPPIWQHVSGSRVLEIGCGTGRHTKRLVALGNDVTAIEPSEGMLEIARRKLLSERIQFIHADFLEYVWPAGTTFDCVILSLVLEHIRDLQPFFQKISNMLDQGGELFLSEIHPLRIAAGSQARFVDPDRQEEILLQSFAHLEHEIIAAASAAGLVCKINKDFVGDDELARLHAGWEKYLGKPMIKVLGFQK